MPFLYQLAIYLLFALSWPFLFLHRKLRQGIPQRLGFYRPDQFPQRAGPRIWLHGASAGDLLALKPVIDGLRQRLPEALLVVSTLTNSGHLMAEERLRGVDSILYLPYDLPGATRRALNAVRPQLLILEYTEIWPNLIRAAKRAGALVALNNGRFSLGKLRNYRWLFAVFGNPLRLIDLFLMREDVEAERALELGAVLDRVWVTGNTKFDAQLPPEPVAVESSLRVALEGTGPLWIAGSTHEGEEGMLLEIFSRLRLTYPKLRLVLAPRYIDRAGRLLALARERQLTARLRSDPATGPCDVIVLDTMGELGQAYRMATLVFVGGSFTRRGGQNILEPAAVGKPVLFGPNMENFYDSVQVLVGRGGIQVKDPEQLHRVLHDLLGKPERIAELGTMAQAAVRSVRGAGQRNVEHLIQLLEAA